MGLVEWWQKEPCFFLFCFFPRAYTDSSPLTLLAFAETWEGGKIQRSFMVKATTITTDSRLIAPHALNTSSPV